MINVYLAGPITGTSYDDCTDWRNKVNNDFRKFGVTGVSPMRHKTYLKDEAILQKLYKTALSSQRGIFARDSWDVDRCDAIFVNLLYAKDVSIGTVMEISWAWQKRIPIILVMEKHGNVHDHPMILEACPFQVGSLAEGVKLTRALFET